MGFGLSWEVGDCSQRDNIVFSVVVFFFVCVKDIGGVFYGFFGFWVWCI